MGVLAFKQGFAAWAEAEGEAGFASYAVAALEALRQAATGL